MKLIFVTLTLSLSLSSASFAAEANAAAAKIDDMLSSKSIQVCGDLSKDLFEKFRTNPKRIKDFVDPKVMKSTCAFAFKPKAQECAVSFLKKMDELKRLSEKELRRQGAVHQAEFSSCIQNAEVGTKKDFEKAATDKALAESLMENAIKELDRKGL